MTRPITPAEEVALAALRTFRYPTPQDADFPLGNDDELSRYRDIRGALLAADREAGTPDAR